MKREGRKFFSQRIHISFLKFRQLLLLLTCHASIFLGNFGQNFHF